MKSPIVTNVMSNVFTHSVIVSNGSPLKSIHSEIAITKKKSSKKYIPFVYTSEKSSHRSYRIGDGCLYIDPIKRTILMESNLMGT